MRCESGDHRATAERILNGVGGVEASTRGADYRAAGWRSFDSAAAPYDAGQVMAERRERYPEDRSFMSPGDATLGQSDDLRTEPVRNAGLGDPANPSSPTERNRF